MKSMASRIAQYCALSSPPHHHQRDPSSPSSSSSSSIHSINSSCKFKPSRPAVLLSSFTERRPSYNSLVFQAVKILGPPARFEASKLKVVFAGDEVVTYTRIVPRTYTLSHCDFTANLTLTVSNVISHDQLIGWYSRDDVLAEWTDNKGELCLDVHCYVSGPNPLLDIAAEFRYHIFSKELPLVLEAVLYGDSVLFREHQELMDALVRVYFHSSSKKYNRVECWGPLKHAAQGGQDYVHNLLSTAKEESQHPNLWGFPKFIFQALAAFLL